MVSLSLHEASLIVGGEAMIKRKCIKHNDTFERVEVIIYPSNLDKNSRFFAIDSHSLPIC